MGNYAGIRLHLSRISFRIRAKTKESGPKMKDFPWFWLITGLFLIAAYMTGVLPGGIQH